MPDVHEVGVRDERLALPEGEVDVGGGDAQGADRTVAVHLALVDGGALVLLYKATGLGRAYAAGRARSVAAGPCAVVRSHFHGDEADLNLAETGSFGAHELLCYLWVATKFAFLDWDEGDAEPWFGVAIVTTAVVTLLFLQLEHYLHGECTSSFYEALARFYEIELWVSSFDLECSPGRSRVGQL